MPGLRRGANRLKVGKTRRAPDEIDLAPNSARGKIDRVIENQSATWVYFAVAEIERLGQSDRADEIRSAAKKFRIDRCAGYFDMAFVEDESNLILLGDLPGQIEAASPLRISCNHRNQKSAQRAGL